MFKAEAEKKLKESERQRTILLQQKLQQSSASYSQTNQFNVMGPQNNQTYLQSQMHSANNRINSTNVLHSASTARNSSTYQVNGLSFMVMK
jgi:hypothetical protein